MRDNIRLAQDFVAGLGPAAFAADMRTHDALPPLLAAVEAELGTGP